jgi:hypothetical protein
MAKISEELSAQRSPRKGDRLLRISGGRNRAITFSDHPLQRHADIWDGYMRAGSALIRVCGSEPSECHTLIYPILFSYRHALEIAMKWIVSRYGRFAGIPEPAPEHNLWQLWGSCKRVITQISGENEDGVIDAVGSIIKEFHDVDGSALAFRYSKHRDGVCIRLPNGSVDLANLAGTMEQMARFLDGTDALLDELTSNAY